jgi:lipid II:glycine glycyltransferase (peptidoglycan interpeptide bridge formation enzyme)
MLRKRSSKLKNMKEFPMICREAASEDRNKWDSFLSSQKSGNFYQGYAWGEIKALSGWKPVRLCVESNGQFRAVISMLKKEIPYTGRSVFYAQGGPVIDWNEQDTLDCLVNGIKSIAKKHGAILLRIQPEPVEDGAVMQNRLKEQGFSALNQTITVWNRALYTLRVNLEKSESELFSQIRKITRRQINSGYKKGITVENDSDVTDVKIFPRLMAGLESRKETIRHDYDYYKKIWEETVPREHGILIKAKLNGNVISMALVATTGNKSWVSYLVNDYNYRNLMPNKILLWEAIKWSKNAGCEFCDLDATQGMDFDPKESLNHSKMAFRPEVVKFPGYFDLVFSQVLYRLWSIAEFTLLPLFYKMYVKKTRNQG